MVNTHDLTGTINTLPMHIAGRILSIPSRRELTQTFCRPLAGQSDPWCKSRQRQTGKYPGLESYMAHRKQRWREFEHVQKMGLAELPHGVVETPTSSISSFLQSPREKLVPLSTTVYPCKESHKQSLYNKSRPEGLARASMVNTCLVCGRPCVIPSTTVYIKINTHILLVLFPWRKLMNIPLFPTFFPRVSLILKIV